MFKKRGKMGQPVKNGTRYKKCTLATFSFQHALIRNNTFIKIWTFFLPACLFGTYSLTDT